MLRTDLYAQRLGLLSFRSEREAANQQGSREPPPELAPGHQEAMAELDNTAARSVAAFLAKAGRQPDDMLRFFDRKDYFCLVGRDAETVAVEYFKSTACIKSVQSGGERRSYLSINKKMASEVMRAALLTQRRRVEVYRPDMGSWVLQRRGSPGNLQAFEEECGLDTDAGADTSPVIVAVSIGKTAGSKGYAGNGRLVGVAFIDSTVRSSIRTSELPPTLTPDPNP